MLLVLGVAAAQDQAAPKLNKRFGYEYTESLYPQKKPEDAIQSIVKALGSDRVDYLLAHLADPKFVDGRVAEYKAFYKGGEDAKVILAFERLVRETTLHFQEDPQLLKELRRFAKEGMWDTKEDVAEGTLKGTPRRIYLRKLEDRWFLENRQQ